MTSFRADKPGATPAREAAAEQLIPSIRFLCERLGDREPQSVNHSEVAWVMEAALKNLPADQFIPGLKEQWLQLIERYKKSQAK